MRLWVLSDLHLEFGPLTLPEVAADGVIVAGDVCEGPGALDWLKAAFPNIPVFFVLGNHEYYNHTLPFLRQEIQKRARGTNIHVLENGQAEVGGVAVLGCTLWTSYALTGHPAEPMRTAAERMRDFDLIRFAGEGDDERSATRLEPLDTALIHQASVRWLESSLALLAGQRVVVVTHHAPSARSIAEAYKGHPLSPAFASNLDALVEKTGAALWVHGHVHERFDYRIGRTRVLCNPRGYADRQDTGFDPALVVEV